MLFIFTLISGCSEKATDENTAKTQETVRNFKMGFTPWQYAATFESQTTTYNRLNTHGDIIKHHFMGGIPWQAALDQTAYSDNLQAEINGRLAQTSKNSDVFLAIDSLNDSRNALTLNWGDSQNMPLTGLWADRSWSSPEVITAYINFATDLINRFKPTHFEYGTEVSELILNNPDGYTDYLVFAEAVYSQLSKTFPDLKILVSVAMKSPDSNEMQIIKASMVDIMPFTDVLGISIYPYVFFNHLDKGDPDNLPGNWLTQAKLIAKTKPMAISETGWIAEDLVINDFSYSEKSDENKQAKYVELLLQSAQDLKMEFVIWWVVTDFDVLWSETLAENAVAKIWKDTGLYNENQQHRSGLSIWDSWLDK